MARRNLTFDSSHSSPDYDSDSPLGQDIRNQHQTNTNNINGNPFIDSNNIYSDSTDDFSYYNQNQNQNQNQIQNQNGFRDRNNSIATSNTHSAKPYILNDSSYINNNNNNNNNSSTGANNSINSNNNNQNGLNTEFDRYPQRISSRQSIGTQSIASGKPLLNGSDISPISSNASFSEQVSNPFLIDADFSPFGGYPASSFPLHLDEKEDDDYLHNPDPIADAKYDRQCHRWDSRGILNLTSILAMIGGAIGVFIVLPALTFSGKIDVGPPVKYEQLSTYKYSTLGAIRGNLVDPDTPSSARSKFSSRLNKNLTLVFSDEFNAEGRTFHPNDDQFWEGVNLNYAATQDLEWYDPNALTTENGSLVIRLDAFKNHNLQYRSGMLQSWNKLCYRGGLIEVSASFPGPGRVIGLWPGMWTMGNLGRPGYLGSTNGVWPYSYNSCDVGITANQSSSDGLSYLPGQRLNVCTCEGEDHPNPGVGRGAPEIDIIEGSADTGILTAASVPGVGVVTQSLQLAPFDPWWLPNYNFTTLNNYTTTLMNSYTGGPFQQAVSAQTTLNNNWYDGDQFQSYAFEYEPGEGSGYIEWKVGDQYTMYLDGRAIGPNGNVDVRPISYEPMSIIFNLGVSNAWAYIDWPSIKFPAVMRIDYVRIYQDTDNPLHSLTCDPEGHPTTDYINNHPKAYMNPNLTTWESTGYDWPKNSLVDGCST